MKSSFLDIKNSSTFPLDKIIGVLDWKDDFYSASYSRLISTSNQTQSSAIPVFLIDGKKHIPVVFGKEFDGKHFFDFGFESYDSFFKLIEKFSKTNFKRVANPSYLETIFDEPLENRFSRTLYGLIPFIDGQNLDVFKFNKSNEDIQKTFYEIALASQELSDNDFINLDIHKGNIIKTVDSVVLVDSCLVPVYFRSRGDHISDRNLYSHYSPEVCYGGLITEKSQIYSVGATFRNIISSEFDVFYETSSLWKKNRKIIASCLAKKPSKRPSSKELVGLLESL
ncbi:hypothetical protein JXA48_00210 [Candidatus Woesearchaeota archaeon]|nr:hypothetical protein [Candidatus Woesearchaeota archaeon]